MDMGIRIKRPAKNIEKGALVINQHTSLTHQVDWVYFPLYHY